MATSVPLRHQPFPEGLIVKPWGILLTFAAITPIIEAAARALGGGLRCWVCLVQSICSIEIEEEGATRAKFSYHCSGRFSAADPIAC